MGTKKTYNEHTAILVENTNITGAAEGIDKPKLPYPQKQNHFRFYTYEKKFRASMLIVLSP